MNYVVVKFGGTSVASMEKWQTIARIAQKHVKDGHIPVVVCSAITGVSNLLDQICTNVRLGKDTQADLSALLDIHRTLGQVLGVASDALLHPLVTDLVRCVQGASLIQEISPRLQAHIMAFGELASTTLGAAFLQQTGLNVGWQDARRLLRSRTDPLSHRHYLSATCVHEPDVYLQKTLQEQGHAIILTQGFIASDDKGATVLLGRGGSDTSAAYLAAKLQAIRCEIWTDVAGLYTANPRDIPSARLLRHLDYQEAQEIATMGAKVLHPRCIGPVQQQSIPLHVYSTQHPDMQGTTIDSTPISQSACVKAISLKAGIYIVSIENLGMWQEVGFLADLFGIMKQHGICVDLISTSESNVTVTLDPAANALSPACIATLEQDLGHLGKVTTLTNCTSISLVGRSIRSILPTLGNALQVFEAQQIHLVSQAANDLNLTFVVDSKHANRLLTSLHTALFDTIGQNAIFGPTYQETACEPVSPSIPWWERQQAQLLNLAHRHTTPLYVYDAATLTTQANRLTSIPAIDQIFFAVKANNNKEVIRTLVAAGIGCECVSLQELEHIRTCVPRLGMEQVIFAPNFAPQAEYAAALQMGCHVTLDNLYPLAKWPQLFAHKQIFLRIDPGFGKGHHAHVKTGGSKSKFGIPLEDVLQAKALADQAGATVVGLHVHAGSGITDPTHWSHVATLLGQLATEFPDVRILNIGGGLGVPYKPLDTSVELTVLADALMGIKQQYPHLHLWLEPGRYLVAQAGVLLCQVTQTKSKAEHHYIGVNTGMNALLRPALYGAYHHIANLTRLKASADTCAHVVGPICESADMLGYARVLPHTHEGDIMLIADTGAYGQVMASAYNMRTAPPEIFLQSAAS